jgi:hypothetical protein
MTASFGELRGLNPQDWLTQLGPKYPNRPKPGQNDVSLWLGQLSVEQTVQVVGGRPVRKRDEVRYFQAGCLRDAGFVLEADTKLVNGETHVSTTTRGQWTDEDAARFEACAGREWSGEA